MKKKFKKVLSRFQSYKLSLLLAILSVLIVFSFNSKFAVLENIYTDLRFDSRGKSALDSSIIVLFFNDEEIEMLGGYSNLSRHAGLLVTALNTFNAKAIGFYLNFQNTKNSHELNKNTQSALQNDNVCFAFFAENSSTPWQNTQDAAGTSINTSTTAQGNEIDISIAEPNNLIQNYPSINFGHSILSGEPIARSYPAFVNSGGKYIFPFAVEISRIYHGISKDSVFVQENKIIMRDSPRVIQLPIFDNKIFINFSGGFNEVNTLSGLKFLESYMDYITGVTPEMPLEIFKDKIVIIGTNSQLKGQYLATPFHELVPSTIIQANAVNTILHEYFIFHFSLFAILLMTFFLNFVTVHLILKSELLTAIVTSFSIAIIYIFASIFLFSYDIIMPIHPLLVMPLSFFLAVVVRLVQENQQPSRLPAMAAPVDNQKENDKVSAGYIPAVDDTNIKENGKEPIVQKDRIDGLQKEKNGEAANSHVTIPHVPYEKIDFSRDVEEFYDIVCTRNGAIHKILELINKVAPSDAPILITGESGTGKELIARLIHKLSARINQNFIALNCASLPENLLESELFGHEKGAFTGADKHKIGHFEAADKGTIFLDEIAEMSEPLQSKLLRVLQFNEFYHVGSVKPIKVDVRVIAATNKSPQKEVETGRLRQDLYYRINTIQIDVPPLRERKEDIIALVTKFMEKEQASDIHILPRLYEALYNCLWPGNVRQLESVIKRATILAKSEARKELHLSDLPEEISCTIVEHMDLEEQILASLREKGFSHKSINDTAYELGGIHRSTVTEYFRGLVLKELAQNRFNIDKASQGLAGTKDKKIISRIKRKNAKYLDSIMKNIDRDLSRDELLDYLRKKYKNLPNRYHTYLDKTVLHFMGNQRLEGI